MELEETTPSDLPPEYCHYQDDGCELTASCLKCPFPGCIYDEPRGKQLEDRNIGSISQAEARGDAHLRGAEIDSAYGLIRIPANSGQQLYDVIEITDGRAGLDAQKKRVLGLILSYNPGRGEYQHRLLLGAV